MAALFLVRLSNAWPMGVPRTILFDPWGAFDPGRVTVWVLS